MGFAARTFDPKLAAANERVEAIVNTVVRRTDDWLGAVGLGGRRARYDDARYEFVGGASDELRRKHYDKSLRLLWKAQRVLPWSTFRDETEAERALGSLSLSETELKDAALQAMNEHERAVRDRIKSREFQALLDQHYSPAERRALTRVLAAIGHGEAYAWLVSASLLGELKSTGAKAAVTMQVLEEAKHFVVLRELLQALSPDVPRQSVWEYLLLEGVLRARPLDRFFGMNVLVETIALGIFGLFADKPGFEALAMFHLDESRHTALPANYFKEFPLSSWEKKSPLARLRRLGLALPAVPLVMLLEADLATLGVDAFEFGGAIIRKAVRLAHRAGFALPGRPDDVLQGFNVVFNAYAWATRSNHVWCDYTGADRASAARTGAVDKALFGA